MHSRDGLALAVPITRANAILCFYYETMQATAGKKPSDGRKRGTRRQAMGETRHATVETRHATAEKGLYGEIPDTGLFSGSKFSGRSPFFGFWFCRGMWYLLPDTIVAHGKGNFI